MEQLKRYEEALSLLDEVIEVRPAETSYYLLQASVYLAMNRPDEAITNLDLVRRLGKLDAENHLLLANLHLRSGSGHLARPVMMAALEMEQKAAYGSVINLLEFASITRDWSLARDFATAMQKAYPDASDAKLEQKREYLLAFIDIESEDHPERGAKVLEGIIKQDPLSASSLILLARYRAKEQRHQEAVMLLEQAVRVQGHEYSANLELAKVCVSTRRYDKAIDHLDKALKIQPSDELLTYREAIQNLAVASE